MPSASVRAPLGSAQLSPALGLALLRALGLLHGSGELVAAGSCSHCAPSWRQAGAARLRSALPSSPRERGSSWQLEPVSGSFPDPGGSTGEGREPGADGAVLPTLGPLVVNSVVPKSTHSPSQRGKRLRCPGVQPQKRLQSPLDTSACGSGEGRATARRS